MISAITWTIETEFCNSIFSCYFFFQSSSLWSQTFISSVIACLSCYSWSSVGWRFNISNILVNLLLVQLRGRLRYSFCLSCLWLSWGCRSCLFRDRLSRLWFTHFRSSCHLTWSSFWSWLSFCRNCWSLRWHLFFHRGWSHWGISHWGCWNFSICFSWRSRSFCRSYLRLSWSCWSWLRNRSCYSSCCLWTCNFYTSYFVFIICRNI